MARGGECSAITGGGGEATGGSKKFAVVGGGKTGGAESRRTAQKKNLVYRDLHKTKVKLRMASASLLDIQNNKKSDMFGKKH